MISVLFVCMGNICRSPSAEGFLRHRLAESGWADRVRTDSAGTHGYHVGQPPDDRAIAVAAEHGVDISDLRARRVTSEDFQAFDLVIGMDQDNLRQLQGMTHASDRAQLSLMMSFAGNDSGYREVPDPYYGDLSDFRLMCTLLDQATDGLMAHLQARLTNVADERSD